MTDPIIIIPARSGSSRLPNKLLLDLAGKPVIQRTWENCQASGCRTVIAADRMDEELVRVCKEFGAKVVLTSSCPSGTCRVDEAASVLGLCRTEMVINVQADEPMVDVGSILRYLEHAIYHRLFLCDTQAYTFALPPDPRSTRVRMLDGDQRKVFTRVPHTHGWLHLGVYAYLRHILDDCAGDNWTYRAYPEDLEQMSWRVPVQGMVVHIPGDEPLKLDTMEDYKALTQKFENAST